MTIRMRVLPTRKWLPAQLGGGGEHHHGEGDGRRIGDAQLHHHRDEDDHARRARNLRASADVGSEVNLSWTAPSDDGGRDIVGYEFAVDEDAEEDDGVRWTMTLDDLNSGWATVNHVAVAQSPASQREDLLLPSEGGANANGPNDPQGNGPTTASATPAGPPPAPELDRPPPVVAGNRRVELTWTRIPTRPFEPGHESVSGYQYRQLESGTGGAKWELEDHPQQWWSPAPRSYTVTGLTNGTTYRFQVRAKNSAGNGRPSTEVRAVPRGGCARRAHGADGAGGRRRGDAVLDRALRQRRRAHHRVRVQGTRPNVCAADDAGDWTATGGTGTTVTVYGLDNGTTYYFKVRAVNDLGCTNDRTGAVVVRSPLKYPPRRSASPLRASTSLCRCPTRIVGSS